MKYCKIFVGIALAGIVVPLVILTQTLWDPVGYRRGSKRLVPKLKEDMLVQERYQLPRVKQTNSTPSPHASLQYTTQRQRTETLQYGCQRLQKRGFVPSAVSGSQLNHIIVDDHYKVMFCYIPKVACTNMKRVFLLLTGKMNTTNPLDIKSNDVHFKNDKYLKYLSDYNNAEDINFRIKNYKKVIFVREPLERLLSAYRNKFTEKSDYFQKRFGRKIIRRYRENPSNSSLQLGNDVDFIEFVKYITDPKTMEQEGYNEHWAQYSALCHPCVIKYDFIGKYETLDEDVSQVLKELYIDKIVKFPSREANYKKKKTKDTMVDFYGRIPSTYQRSLWKIYATDYRLFGYPYPEMFKQSFQF